jgi:hypothetical protein
MLAIDNDINSIRSACGARSGEVNRIIEAACAGLSAPPAHFREVANALPSLHHNPGQGDLLVSSGLAAARLYTTRDNIAPLICWAFQ